LYFVNCNALLLGMITLFVAWRFLKP
jgi:hypothetical protein